VVKAQKGEGSLVDDNRGGRGIQAIFGVWWKTLTLEWRQRLWWRFEGDV